MSSHSPEGNSSNSPDGQVAVVTGGARGIGRACALRLVSAGADEVVIDQDLDGAAQFGEALSKASVADEIEAWGRCFKGYELNLADRSAVTKAFADIWDSFGRVDVLVNMAGGETSPIERSKASIVPDEHIELLLDVNLRTVINCSQAAIPAFMRPPESS